MIPRYIDVHCHVQFDQYDPDRDALIAKMNDGQVAGIVVGVDAESSTKAVMLAEQFEHLCASVGQHPNHDEPFDEATLRGLLKNPQVVAVGECGLDYFRPEVVDEKVKERQQELFKKHVALAAEFDKPLIIHARPSKGTQDAYQDLIEILGEAKSANSNLRGDIHFFVGGVAEADALVALGFTVSFTAVVTFARDYDEVIKHVPLTSILAETDAPYVAPAARRGQRNDPLSVVDVVGKIAEIRGEDSELVRQALLSNAKSLFSLA